MNSEVVNADYTDKFGDLSQNTNVVEIEPKSFLAEIDNERITTEHQHWQEEFNHTYNADLDRPSENESIDYLKNKSLENEQEYLVTIQKWKGHITKLFKTSFLAELDDLTAGGTKEVTEFENREVYPSERELIGIGAVFYFYIAYRIRMGTLRKESVLKFQKPIEWKVSDFDDAIDRAGRLAKLFSEEG
ncbi:MAG TPA: hypothetical protein VKA08_19335 [Balneolales bacterium]|jgi:hypothetical protein|nr:hypothetical protein [Balneolales bacterium]